MVIDLSRGGGGHCSVIILTKAISSHNSMMTLDYLLTKPEYFLSSHLNHQL